MRKDILAGLLPQGLVIIWAIYELIMGINNEQNSRIFLSSIFILLFVMILVVTLVKIKKYPNDPTYLKKKNNEVV
ncbi:hypothetical protein [Chishuiella sp.]|uniref:hypothetical protein n=1 Tax=Chishuiella sp. TaxID=1969467 RepID=UPI0028AD6FCA|nr:hypothetical protein [Chishuiella sp.]